MASDVFLHFTVPCSCCPHFFFKCKQENSWMRSFYTVTPALWSSVVCLFIQGHHICSVTLLLLSNVQRPSLFRRQQFAKLHISQGSVWFHYLPQLSGADVKHRKCGCFDDDDMMICQFWSVRHMTHAQSGHQACVCMFQLFWVKTKCAQKRKHCKDKHNNVNVWVCSFMDTSYICIWCVCLCVLAQSSLIFSRFLFSSQKPNKHDEGNK